MRYYQNKFVSLCIKAYIMLHILKIVGVIVSAGWLGFVVYHMIRVLIRLRCNKVVSGKPKMDVQIPVPAKSVTYD